MGLFSPLQKVITAVWKSPEMHKSILLITGAESSSLMPFIHSLLHIVIHFKAQQRKRDNSIWHLFIPLIKAVKTRLVPARRNETEHTTLLPEVSFFDTSNKRIHYFKLLLSDGVNRSNSLKLKITKGGVINNVCIHQMGAPVASIISSDELKTHKKLLLRIGNVTS